MEKAAEGIEIKTVSKEEYEATKKQLKRKKSPDQEGWRYEWVENAGKDLEKIIRRMMNAMLKHRKPAEEWRAMRIKVTTKKKTKKMEMEFKRGLFLTNIINKCVEMILLMRRKEALMESMQPFQNGGAKGRGKEYSEEDEAQHNRRTETKKKRRSRPVGRPGITTRPATAR